MDARAEVVDAVSERLRGQARGRDRRAGRPVWASIVQPATWWDSRHTWSGSAANLSLAAASGGCFCERLPNGGSVLHMSTVNAVPNQKLVLFGALGPLQSSGAAGHWPLSWSRRTARPRSPSPMTSAATSRAGSTRSQGPSMACWASRSPAEGAGRGGEAGVRRPPTILPLGGGGRRPRGKTALTQQHFPSVAYGDTSPARRRILGRPR
jgi:hypothetical protein